MKKVFTLLSVAALMIGALSAHETADDLHFRNAAHDIPLIGEEAIHWKKVSDVAQYKQADWSQAIGRAENVTVTEAKKIADSNPDITYFFYVKGEQMVLENFSVKPPVWRIFHHGDAVFFTGEPWWGSAPGLADGYIRQDFSLD